MVKSFDPDAAIGTLDGLLHMEEERYLRTVARYLDLAGVDVRIDSHAAIGYPNWYLDFPTDNDGGASDIWVGTGGEECDFDLAIVDPSNDRFTSLPWGKPVTAAYIIVRYLQSVGHMGVAKS